MVEGDDKNNRPDSVLILDEQSKNMDGVLVE
jgi:hypothetical protein